MTTLERPALRPRILAGEILFGLFVDLDSPVSAEICGRAGYDWLVIDLEHGAASEASLLAHLHAVETTPAATIVRPQSGERLRIGRALDLGADGIMIPQSQSAADARVAARHLHYPPAGDRGIALRTRGAKLGAVGHGDVGAVNDGIVGIVQIESPGAVAEADEIAAIVGVDVLFVGPADLSHTLGVPGQFTSDTYRGALRAVVAAADAHGKAAGILVYDPGTVPGLLEMGFRFIGIGADGAFVADAARAALREARGAAATRTG